VPKKKHHGRGKQTPEGISEREKAFAEERRRDPGSQGWLIAKRAGFLGDNQTLSTRARVLMKKAAVLAIIHAPDQRDPLDGDDGELNDEKLLGYLKRTLLSIVRSHAADKDKLSAIDKLISTVPGGYAPLQVDSRNVVTMEVLLRAMGGAPDQLALPQAAQGEQPDGEEAQASNA
jgi:hypothetical protein